MNEKLTKALVDIEAIRSDAMPTGGGDSVQQVHQARGSLDAFPTDELIAELMTRFQHAVFAAMWDDGRERFEFRGNYIIGQGLGTSIASRVADARRKAESQEQ